MKKTMKSHMAEMHEKCAGHHEAMAKCDTAKAAALRELGESLENGESCDKAADAFDKSAAEHTDMAAYHNGECDTMKVAAKADEAAELAKRDQIVPDGVHGIIPSDVPRDTIRPRAVARTGQPSIDRTAVDPMFEDFLKIEE